jgi:hypothetical protein
MKKNIAKATVIEQLRKTPIVEYACSRAGVGRTTFYRWRKEDKEFAGKADEALREGLSLVTDMAESQLIAAIKAGQLPAIVFWLKHRHADYKTKVEINGQIEQVDEKLTPEQAAIVDRALRLASLDKTDHETN